MVVFSDARKRFFQLAVIDAQTGLLRELQLHSRVDHAFEYLLFKDLDRWRLRALLTQLLDDYLELVVEVTARDDIFVHHGNDAVEQHDAARSRLLRRRVRRTAQGERERDYDLGQEDIHT